jgi:hypothetical protein
MGRSVIMKLRYRVLGLDLVSAVPLPPLRPLEGPSSGCKVIVEFGPVPDALDAPVLDRPLLQIAASGLSLFRVPGIARYLIRGRRQLIIDCHPGTPFSRMIDVMCGTPLALLCCHWGRVPLRAACAAVDGKAILLSGGPGEGKSTLALCLTRLGCEFLGDSLVALDLSDQDVPMIWPSHPEARLWPDAMTALGFDTAGAEATPGGRFSVSLSDHFCPRPLALRAIVMSLKAEGGLPEGIARLEGYRALERILPQMSNPEAGRLLLGDPLRFAAIARLAQLPLFERRYIADLSKLDIEAARLLEILRASVA